MPSDSCVFCQIVAGEAEASFAYADVATVVFADRHPVNPGHVLVVPRRHISRIADLDAATASGIWATAVLVGSAITVSGGESVGINVLLSDGEVAGQEVAHVHAHVIPRHRDDGFHIDADAWHDRPPSRQQLDDSVVSLRAALSMLESRTP
jgi:diadenosine tetraphosphate (Ap4A) HIT family hydrolase